MLVIIGLIAIAIAILALLGVVAIATNYAIILVVIGVLLVVFGGGIATVQGWGRRGPKE
jgi:hypothetical protein